MTNQQLIHLKTITPLHVGGSFERSIVDLPIQREKPTQFPKIEASSLKGSLRHHVWKNKKGASETDIATWFGEEKGKETNGEEAGGKKGEVVFTDARILFFPVRSPQGIFAYVTCPFVMERYYRDYRAIGGAEKKQLNLQEIQNQAVVTEDSHLVFSKDNKHFVVLEELRYEVTKQKDFKDWLTLLPQTIQEEVKGRVICVPNDDFTYFVKHSTEISTRIRISAETGTVEDGALFTEEYVPVEAFFYTALLNGAELLDYIKPIVQVGGNATLGKGMLQVIKGEESR